MYIRRHSDMSPAYESRYSHGRALLQEDDLTGNACARRQRIRAAMKEGTLAGQDIVDELDRMSLIGSPRPPSEPTDSPAASAHQWASPSFVRQTQDAGSEQELSFHRPFREGHKPGHARADRAASLADERLSVDGRGVGPTRGHHKLSDRSNSTSLRHEV